MYATGEHRASRAELLGNALGSSTYRCAFGMAMIKRVERVLLALREQPKQLAWLILSRCLAGGNTRLLRLDTADLVSNSVNRSTSARTAVLHALYLTFGAVLSPLSLIPRCLHSCCGAAAWASGATRLWLPRPGRACVREQIMSWVAARVGVERNCHDG